MCPCGAKESCVSFWPAGKLLSHTSLIKSVFKKSVPFCAQQRDRPRISWPFYGPASAAIQETVKEKLYFANSSPTRSQFGFLKTVGHAGPVPSPAPQEARGARPHRGIRIGGESSPSRSPNMCGSESRKSHSQFLAVQARVSMARQIFPKRRPLLSWTTGSCLVVGAAVATLLAPSGKCLFPLCVYCPPPLGSGAPKARFWGEHGPLEVGMPTCLIPTTTL